MMFIFVFTFSLFGLVYGNCDDFRRIDAIKQEQLCISNGGMCTIARDCPVGLLSEKSGLCPQQRSQGIECCYGFSVKETRCSKHGGICIPTSQGCNEKLIFDRATDCPGQKCCILV